MNRLCLALLTLFIALNLHAADEPLSEFVAQLGHKDAGDQEVASKQIKKAGAKAVPALKAALKDAQGDFKSRIEALLERFDGAGVADQGLSVKLSTGKPAVMPNEKLLFKATLNNQTLKSMVVYLGNQLVDENGKSTGVTSLMHLAEVHEDGEKFVKFASIDGRNYPIGMKYFVFVEIPPLGSVEHSFEAVISDQPTKTRKQEQDRAGITNYLKIRPDPCISLVGTGVHKLRLTWHRPEGKTADIEADENGVRNFQGLKEKFTSKAEYWDGKASSAVIEVMVNARGKVPEKAQEGLPKLPEGVNIPGVPEGVKIPEIPDGIPKGPPAQ